MSDRAITRFDGEYAFLSNFFEHPIQFGVAPTPWNGVWPTAEHLFQAFKCADVDDIERLRRAPSPGAAKRMGRRVSLRPDWEDVKIVAMRTVLAWKFNGGETLAEWLVSTNNRELIEGNHWGDRYWGQVRGEGLNMLGELLMERRGVLQHRREYDKNAFEFDTSKYPN